MAAAGMVILLLSACAPAGSSPIEIAKRDALKSASTQFSALKTSIDAHAGLLGDGIQRSALADSLGAGYNAVDWPVSKIALQLKTPSTLLLRVVSTENFAEFAISGYGYASSGVNQQVVYSVTCIRATFDVSRVNIADIACPGNVPGGADYLSPTVSELASGG